MRNLFHPLPSCILKMNLKCPLIACGVVASLRAKRELILCCLVISIKFSTYTIKADTNYKTNKRVHLDAL